MDIESFKEYLKLKAREECQNGGVPNYLSVNEVTWLVYDATDEQVRTVLERLRKKTQKKDDLRLCEE